jgi:hypothetical protein
MIGKVSTNNYSEGTQGRICFVIMPFSKTNSCTEEEWTRVFEDVIKPAVEAASYDCRRSTATRGNLIKEIIQDLDASWVVLADLTDRNPNVFYELGVRHALKDRTILIAQKRNDIPFDLHSYANHVYNWRTPQGKEEFAERIKALLEDVDKDPHRADNPVSDFLETPVRREQPATVTSRLNNIEDRLDSIEAGPQLFDQPRETSSGSDTAIKALGESSPLEEGTPAASWFDAGVEIATSSNLRALRKIVIRTKRDIGKIIPPKIQELSTLSSGYTIQRDKIATEALKFEDEFAPLTENIEQLALALVSVDWPQGARSVLDIAGSLISVGEGQSGLRFATGLPAFFAWRMLLLSGAHSVQEEAFSVTSTLINSPIPVVRLGGQPTFRSLIKHRELFYPEALMGYADLGIKQIKSQYERSKHIHKAFASSEDFQISLAEFLILVALRDASEKGRPLYPGYRLLLTAFTSACGRLVSRLKANQNQLTAVAQVFNRTGDELLEAWPNLAAQANSAELGSGYLVDTLIPTTLGSEEE